MVGKLGILAGAGELPRRIIEACRAANRDFFVLAFKGEADLSILAGVPHATIRLGAAGEGFRLLHEAGVEEIVFAGGLKRPTVTSLRPDWRAAKFFARIG
jgi:UDP-2,3-diacylglucosamine hydrolase